MSKTQYWHAIQDEPSEYAGTLLAGITSVVDRASQTAIFNCDACEQPAPTGDAITSAILTCSRFCSTACRDEAELAAENARRV